MQTQDLRVRHWHQQDYLPMWQAMRDFVDQRSAETTDECWLLEHTPVFTLGQAGKPEHILTRSEIPIVHTDRGGQVTYHGPGQLMMYWLIDLKRRQLGVRHFVEIMEQCVIELLAHHHITAQLKDGAPGVYVEQKKIASLGLRVRKGSTYHGLALNINADLSPFHAINPCGYAGLEMVNMQDLCSETLNFDAVSQELLAIFCDKLAYQATSLNQKIQDNL